MNEKFLLLLAPENNFMALMKEENFISALYGFIAEN